MKKRRICAARRLKSALSGFLALLIIASSVPAQSGTSAVRGTVLDPQGNAVSGAAVKLTDSSRNFSRTQNTKEDGSFVFNSIPPGAYTVEVEISGFKKVSLPDVNALVDTPTELNIQLEVGNVNEVVTVTGVNEAAINASDASIGNTFEARRIEELPLNARNIVNLLSLQPGVTRNGEVNGSRSDQSNITLDGVDVNEQQTGLDIVTGEAFASVLRSTPDSVQEFRVTTSVPNATQGRSSGAQVSLVTKSGTNEFHGSLYEYHRNTATTSNDFFNNSEGRFTANDLEVINGEKEVGDIKVPRPKLIRNIFGGSLGGPIKKDKLFFFYTYEGRRDAAEVSVLQVVPTDTLRRGIVRYRNVDGGITTLTPGDIAALYPETGGVNPAGLAFLQTAPLPNSASTGDGLNTGGFRFNAPTSTELNTHIARLDYTINNNQTFFLRGNYQDDFYVQARQFPNTPAPELSVQPIGFVAGHNWVLSNSLINNLRVGLTRQSFSQGSDANFNLVSFRFVYQPFAFNAATARSTPVWNIVDDISWIKSSHTLQMGANVRFIRNNRISFFNSFDAMVINPSFYEDSGAVLSDPLEDLDEGDTFNARAAVAAVLGRFSQYTASTNYELSGNAQPVGTPTRRSFATEEYEGYAQDVWKLRPNLTLTYGLRYSLGTPVYERNGFQVRPNVDLSEFFERRKAGADAGMPVNDLITLELAGKANDRPGFYEMDKNNFAPSVAVAWSPDFGDNLFGRIFGREGRSVIRGGFRTVYDRVGSALAVNFDLNGAIGFSTASTISANTHNTTDRLGPLFTGLGQSVRGFPALTIPPASITFPLMQPADESQRIETTIDTALKTPVQYTWNVSYGRELGKGFSFDLSYVGRAGRDLLISRDIMHLNNLRDPDSGQTWYEAAGVLADLRDADTRLNRVPRIPFFENLFPNLGELIFGDPSLTSSQAIYLIVAREEVGGFNVTDWTLLQSDSLLDNLSRLGPNAFFHPQYAALTAFSSIGTADYHAGIFSLRHRFREDFIFDLNYTLSKSMDDGSNLESGAVVTIDLLRNPLDLRQSRSVSTFDVRHNVNANWLVALPFGRDKRFLNNLSGFAEALLGGWQLTGIMRYHTGLPVGAGQAGLFADPFDVGRWATNWQLTSNGVRLRDVEEAHASNVDGFPNIFADPVAAYRSYRNARAGEHGDRNILRLPSYFVLDAGLSKSFNMWYAEGHKLQFRWEVFNVTNTQPFGVISTLQLDQDPFRGGEPQPDFGRYIGSQTPVGETRPGRVMQFALRYTF